VIRRSSTASTTTANGPRRKPSRRPSDFHSFPNSPTSVRRGLPASAEDDEDEEDGIEGDNDDWEARLVQAKAEGEGRMKRYGRTVRRWAKVANEFMTVPMWSALISIAVRRRPQA
jgi:hypothetical protein